RAGRLRPRSAMPAAWSSADYAVRWTWRSWPAAPIFTRATRCRPSPTVRASWARSASGAWWSNAAGGINLALHRGGLVLISDHINVQGGNPLVGTNDDALGPRFPDMTEAYSREYREIAHQVAAEQGIAISEGVYAAMLGPSYETPAEIRFLRTIG